MMETVREKAYAKLNLTLDVTGLRADGYHEMCMVMQSIRLCDDLTITTGTGEGIKARTNFTFLPNEDKNIAVQAARLFCESTGIDPGGMLIDINKRIPVGAGMAGGSADAAAVLRTLDRLYDTKLGYDELCRLGMQLGSDVPFCVAGGTVLAEGRGEVFTQLSAMPDCYIVICKPRFSISTKMLFSQIDSVKIEHHPDTVGAMEAIAEGELGELARRLYNVFETVLPRRFSAVADIKRKLIDGGALGSCMTGTGSAVFGLFDSARLAERSQRYLSRQYQDVFLTRPLDRYM